MANAVEGPDCESVPVRRGCHTLLNHGRHGDCVLEVPGTVVDDEGKFLLLDLPLPLPLPLPLLFPLPLPRPLPLLEGGLGPVSMGIARGTKPRRSLNSRRRVLAFT